MAITVDIRSARAADLDAIVALLADDRLGAQREQYEQPLPTAYHDAFQTIDSDSNNEILVATMHQRIVGVLQLTFIPNLTHRGRWRAQIEGVRISSEQRGAGLGHQLIEYAIEQARKRDCHVVQLNTDKSRADAIRFYQSLGFRASHEGFKLFLTD